MKTVTDAIMALNPNAVIKTSANSLDANAVDTQITWLDGTAEISNADIQAKLDELRTAEANRSASDRAKDKLRDMGFAEDEVALLIHE